VLLRGWSGVPPVVRFIVAAEVLVFGYGTVLHLAQLLVGGLQPYAWAPAWLAAYFTFLTLADPLAAVLLWARRAAGLYLGALVLVTDAVANWYAIYGLHGGTATARVSQAIISVLAVAAVATAPRVRPWLSPCDARRCLESNARDRSGEAL
jgi:hypothetical protein